MSVTELNETGAFTYDPFAPEVMANPLPFYEIMRDRYPAYYVPKYDTYFLTRYQDVYDALSLVDDSLTPSEGTRITPNTLAVHNDGPVADPPTEPLVSYTMYGSPLYDDVRQAHVKPYQRGKVAQLEPMIRELARRRLGELVPQGRFDVVREFGGIIAASVTCHLFRMPRNEATSVLEAINALTATHERGFFDITDAYDTVSRFTVPVIERRRHEGPDGTFPLVDGLLTLEIEGRGPLTDREISDQLLAVFIGGTEVVPKILGHGLMELARQPDALAEIRTDLEANCRVAYEEILRFCAPAQWFARTVRKPIELAGQKMRPGQRVVVIIASANRDEREYDEPNKFRWNRKIERTLVFGHGTHYCTGVHLARLEGRLLLEEFLRNVPKYRVDESSAIRHPSSFQWGYNSVPVEVA